MHVLEVNYPSERVIKGTKVVINVRNHLVIINYLTHYSLNSRNYNIIELIAISFSH